MDSDIKKKLTLINGMNINFFNLWDEFSHPNYSNDGEEEISYLSYIYIGGVSAFTSKYLINSLFN